MKPKNPNPLLRPSALLLVAFSLSIGWGIRGNFGHEAGAMIAGALSAMAVAILSERDQWRSRVLYFGLFGGLGWGFGGSISYMYPISFTESGDTASTYFGYAALILEGGLWCGLGAAGTALAAVMPLPRLTRFFIPFLFVLAAMGLRQFIEEPLEHWLASAGQDAGDDTWQRHKSPLYWFDADWLQAVVALIGVLAYETYDRFRTTSRSFWAHPLMFIPVAAVSAAVGHFIQWALKRLDVESTVADWLVVPLGDLDYVNPETGGRFSPDQLLTNWPQFFADHSDHLGWGLGLFIGIIIYFLATGKFRNDSSLLLYLALGWLIAFISLPTLGSLALMEHGGMRVMPPRSDDWAGILGVFIAGLAWCWRNELRPISHVMTRGFLWGGIAFATVPMLRFLLRYPGHPFRYPDGVPSAWAHYQSANWHSVLEQMQGFGHGLAIAAAMAMLWRRQPIESDPPNDRRWTLVFAAVFVLCGIGFLNLHKLVFTWIEKNAIPATLNAPLVEAIELTPHGWFRIVWYTATIATTVILLIHLKRRLEFVPGSWLGKGQLLYLIFLWLMVIGNLMRSIPGFSNGRMVTEWILFMNACLVTLLVTLTPRNDSAIASRHKADDWPPLLATWLRGFVMMSVITGIYGFATQSIYQPHLEGKPWANHRRFGPDATWRTKPILKHGDHP